MSDEYLWDRTGSDAEIERLEGLLRPLGLRSETAPALRRPRRSQWVLSLVAVAAAASIAIVVFMPRGTETLKEPRTFEFGKLGRITAEAKSRVKLVRQDQELIKLRLEEGTVHAKIAADARPRLFQVETPATTCVDLGCQYTLTVDRSGCSRVRVTTGKVAFVLGAREVFIPAGAGCEAVPGCRSATPLFDDAPLPVVQAIRAFDGAAPAGRAAAARAVAVLADRQRETLPLWHFLQDSDPLVISAGLDGLIRLVDIPKDISREGSLRGDPGAVAAWKEYLNLVGAWW